MSSEEEQWWEGVVKAFQTIGLTFDELAEVINEWLIQLGESIEASPDLSFDVVDESHGMTVDELIPETIAEWRRTKDEM